MSKKILITFIFILISNIGLISYASESSTYSIDNQYKKNLLSTNNDIVLSAKEIDKKIISPHTWMWGLLLPGLGQIMLGDINTGLLAMIPGTLTLIGSIVSIILINNNDIPSTLYAIVIGAPSLFIFVITQVISIINAKDLNTKLIQKDELTDKEVRDIVNYINKISIKNNSLTYELNF